MPSSIDDDDGDRRSGRTTAQIKRAPPNALMITPNGPHIGVSRHLAVGLGRGDIKFVSLGMAKASGWQRTRGLRGTDAVMLDHACWRFMSQADREEFLELQAAFGW